MDGHRRLPVGAELAPGGGVHFRVWAPRRHTVEVVTNGKAGHPEKLRPEGNGYFSGVMKEAKAGTRYRFRLDGLPDAYPDPASRWQPEGPFGPSVVVDPTTYRWGDGGWRGIDLAGQVFYELHVGTFTAEGTFASAQARLPALRDLGITTIELMPLHEFSGEHGWGYDGVCPFAPAHVYGSPDDVRRFVDQAHALGLGVILDVVYNHFGPAGWTLGQFASSWTTDRYPGEWGALVDFEGPESGPVRELFRANAAYWIDEMHFDGLRLDATQSLHDRQERWPRHIIAELGEAAHGAAPDRRVVVVAENERQDRRLLADFGIDALWNDDFHHAAVVAATDRCDAYYTMTRGTPQELISAARWGFLYQGQWYPWQEARRGSPVLDIEPSRFITYLENHDQVANTFGGRRLPGVAAPGRWRAISTYWLLVPGTPLFFQGQEWAASAPFWYFADHGADAHLAAAVRAGRREFMEQFAHVQPETLPDPCARETFERCKLDWEERDREPHAAALAFHRALLELRREDPTLRRARTDRLHGAVLGPQAFLLRWLGDSTTRGLDRLLVVNLGPDLTLEPAPEPLLAPPYGDRWQTLFSSEDPRWGGLGTPPIEVEASWRLPGATAVLLGPKEVP